MGEFGLSTKPSHEEWMQWSHIAADKLSTCSTIYSQPQNKSGKIDDQERQLRNADILDCLRRIYKLIDRSETPTASLAEVAHHDEQVIDGLALLMRDVLSQLPHISRDMQILLQSHWRESFTSPQAYALFHGAHMSGQEGIGSGYPEHGRLPSVLQDLLIREDSQGRRKPRSDLARHVDETPHDRDGVVLRRWADLNSRFMRRAGQVE